MKYLIDTSAWIEYLEGSNAGGKINDIVTAENSIYTTPQIIGEVISKVKRKRGNLEIAYKTLISRAQIMEATPRIAKEAGILHAMHKEKVPSFSLADSFIIKIAESIQAAILTKDAHFKQFNNIEFI